MPLHHLRRPWLRFVHLLAVLAWIIQPVQLLDAGQSTNNGYTLTVSASPDTVYPGASVGISAQLTDSDGNPVEGATLSFGAAFGGNYDNGSLVTYSATTDSTGVCAVGFTAGQGSNQINVYDGNGYGLSASCMVNVVQPPPQPNYQLSIGMDKNPLNNGETTSLRVQLTDINNAIPGSCAGVGIYFQVANGDAVLGALSATTDSNGNCFIPITAGTMPSQINVVGHTYGETTASNSLVLICPNISDANTFNVSADQNSLPPYGSTTLRASLTDNLLGLPIGGCQVTFTVQSGDGTLTDNNGNPSNQSVATSGNDGTCAVSFHSGTQPTTIQITSTEMMTDGSQTSQSQTFVMGVVYDVYQLNLSSTQTVLQAGQQATVTAQLWDVTTNSPVSGNVLTFQVTDGTYSPAITQVTTDNNGNASITFTGGTLNSTITVTDSSGYGTNQVLAMGVMSTNDQGNLTLSAGNNIVLSGTPVVLHTQLWDVTTGLAASGAVITYTISSGDGLVATDSTSTPSQTITATTDANGNCDIYFYGGLNPSAVTATATDYQNPTASYNFGVMQESYIMYLSAGASSLTQGATTSVNAQLYNTTRSAFITNAPIAFTISGGDATLDGGVTTLSGMTDVSGNCSITLTGGNYTSSVTATDQLGLGTTATCVIAAPSNYQLSMSADQTTLMPYHSTPVHLLLVNNATYPPTPIPNATITLSDSAGYIGSGVTVATGADGTATATYTIQNSNNTVNASVSSVAWADMSMSDNSINGTMAQPITFTPATAPVYQLGITAADPSLPQGQPTTLTATFIDPNSQTAVSGANVSFTVRQDGIGDGSLSNAATTTNSNGQASATFTFGSNTSVVDVTAQFWNNDYYVYCSAANSLTLTPQPPNMGGNYQCSCGCSGTTCNDATNCGNTGSCQPCVCGCVGSTKPVQCQNKNQCMGNLSCNCKCGGDICACTSPNACGGNTTQCQTQQQDPDKCKCGCDFAIISWWGAFTSWFTGSSAAACRNNGKCTTNDDCKCKCGGNECGGNTCSNNSTLSSCKDPSDCDPRNGWYTKTKNTSVTINSNVDSTGNPWWAVSSVSWSEYHKYTGDSSSNNYTIEHFKSLIYQNGGHSTNVDVTGVTNINDDMTQGAYSAQKDYNMGVGNDSAGSAKVMWVWVGNVQNSEVISVVFPAEEADEIHIHFQENIQDATSIVGTTGVSEDHVKGETGSAP